MARINSEIVCGKIPDWKPFVEETFDQDQVKTMLRENWAPLATQYVHLQTFQNTVKEAVGDELWHGSEYTKKSASAAQDAAASAKAGAGP